MGLLLLHIKMELFLSGIYKCDNVLEVINNILNKLEASATLLTGTTLLLQAMMATFILATLKIK